MGEGKTGAGTAVAEGAGASEPEGVAIGEVVGEGDPFEWVHNEPGSTLDVHPQPKVLSNAGPPVGEELAQLVALSEYLAKSRLVPDRLIGRPQDLLVLSLVARDLRLPTVAALTKVHVVDGVPGLSAELMRAVVRREGHQIKVIEADDRHAVVRGIRADTGEQETASFTIEQAAKANLCQLIDGKVVARSNSNKPLPWELYTEDLLVARASSRLCRRLFEDVLLGYTYTPEEASRAAFDVDAVEVKPEQVLPPKPEEGLPGDLPEWLERLLTVHDEGTILDAASPFYKGEGEITMEKIADIPMDLKVELSRRLKVGLDDKIEQGTLIGGCQQHQQKAQPESCDACKWIIEGGD